MEHYLTAWKKYTEFTGRATRSEYWYFTLFSTLIALVLYLLGMAVHPLMILYYLYALAVLLPTIALGARRLHDIGKSAFWMFIVFVPILGGLYLLYLVCQPSKLDTH